ncbi:hypothetical protein BJX99DRAFT_254116 [Aspergillus californicus]
MSTTNYPLICPVCIEPARVSCYRKCHLTVCEACRGSYSPFCHGCCTSCGYIGYTDSLWADEGTNWLNTWDSQMDRVANISDFHQQDDVEMSGIWPSEASLTEAEMLDIGDATLQLLVSLYGPQEAQYESDGMELDFASPEVMLMDLDCQIMDVDFQMAC